MESLDDMALGFEPIIGSDETSVDDKGRIAVGKKNRERLGEGFVLAQGDLGCLIAYPAKIWNRQVADIFSDRGLNPGRDAYSRLVFGNMADEISFDAQGRMVLPKRLREAAKIRDRVVLFGCGDRLEIWSELEWEIFQRDPNGYSQERRQAVAAAYNDMIARRGAA